MSETPSDSDSLPPIGLVNLGNWIADYYLQRYLEWLDDELLLHGNGIE